MPLTIKNLGQGKRFCGASIKDKSSTSEDAQMPQLNVTKLRQPEPEIFIFFRRLFIFMLGCYFLWVIAQVFLVGAQAKLDPQTAIVFYGFVFLVPALTMLYSLGMKARFTLERLQKYRKIKARQHANKTFESSLNKTVEVSPLIPVAWPAFKESLDGMIVKVPTKRAACWRVLSSDEDNKKVQALLTYTPEMLGKKVRDLYPRTILLDATVKGVGCRSHLELKFTVLSPMDNQAADKIVAETMVNLVREVNQMDQSNAAIAANLGLAADRSESNLPYAAA